jgi:hypothetical protein
VFHRQISSSQPSPNGSRLGYFQPDLAWKVIFALSIFTTLAIFAGAGKILNFAFPTGAFIVGIYLYFRAPILYNGFTWWIWFLVPFIRRVADFRSVYTESSPILLAPYLVTGISLITFWKHLPKARRLGGMPFILAILGTFYGYLIGLVNIPNSFTVTREFLDWMPPISFGFHLLINSQSFPAYYHNTQRVFLYGTLLTGIYGVYQSFASPPWDVLWMLNTKMGDYDDSVVGGFRVFSTMQSTEPFSAFMAAGLILLFADSGFLRFPAAAFGYLSFSLTLARSAWLGWFGGLIVFLLSLKAKYQIRLFVVIFVMMLIVLPTVTQGPFADKIGARLQTLSNVSEDNSFSARQENMTGNFEKNLFNVLGSGIGLGGSDNAILSILYALGWIGAICYVGGLITLILQLFQKTNGESNLFLSTARAVVATCLIRLPANGTSINGIGGLIIWGFLGLTIASHRYYQNKVDSSLIRDE